MQVGNICHAAATYTSNHKLIKYLTFDELDSAFPFVLQLPQSQTERLVARYLARLGTEVERRVELVAFEQDEDGVFATLQLADGGQETARVSYLIACDGAHSPVRRALGVSFSGDDYPTDFMTADVQVDPLRAARRRAPLAPEDFFRRIGTVGSINNLAGPNSKNASDSFKPTRHPWVKERG